MIPTNTKIKRIRPNSSSGCVSFIQTFRNGIVLWLQFHFCCCSFSLCVLRTNVDFYWLNCSLNFDINGLRIFFLLFRISVPSKILSVICAANHVQTCSKHSASFAFELSGSLGKYLNSFDHDRHQCHRHCIAICVSRAHTQKKTQTDCLLLFIYLLPKTNECHLSVARKICIQFSMLSFCGPFFVFFPRLHFFPNTLDTCMHKSITKGTKPKPCTHTHKIFQFEVCSVTLNQANEIQLKYQNVRRYEQRALTHFA